MKKQWKLDNKGMTLLEVIVAFAIFAIAAVILMSGFNVALRVMGNSNEIKEASQTNAGKLNVKDSGLETLESLEKSELSTMEGPLKIIQDADLVNKKNFVIPGTFHIATSKDKNNMSLKLFEPDTSRLQTPVVPTPQPEVSEEKKVPAVPNNIEAYYNPDDRYLEKVYNPEKVGWDEKAITYFESNGELITKKMKPGSYYIDTVGDTLTKGVVSNTIEASNNWIIARDQEHLKQLFFINQIPFKFTSKGGGLMYVTDFLYLGSNNKDSADTSNVIKIFGDENKQNRCHLVLRSIKRSEDEFDNLENPIDPKAVFADHTALLYLPKTLEIKVYTDWKLEDESTVIRDYDKTIPAGYYEVPCGTDVLSAVYDETEFSKYSEPESKGGYQRTYEDVKVRLSESQVKTIEE